MPQHNAHLWGSRWNKWDLHIHTPFSVLNNGFGDDWDTYVHTLFSKALEKNIRAIGITDYYLIDGYKKLREEYLSDDAKLGTLFSETEVKKIKDILVIPNIEFRIDKLVVEETEFKWNRKVNFHLLLSDQIPIPKIEGLLSDLKFDGIAVDKKIQQKSLTRNNLEEVGEALRATQPEFAGYSALKVGMICAAINTKQLQEALENDLTAFRGKYFFALPADEDLSDVDWASGGHLERKNLILRSHFILTGNPGTVAFCLGKKHDNEQAFIDEFESVKPCIWGSDAHDFDKMFEPDMGRHTWIKAAPTFEGLRQVMFEPSERVRIQQNIPTEKVPYRVIDRVRFVDSEGSKKLTSDWIRLNENLSVIIGGKSSGKSLLLHHIAEAVDPLQVNERSGADRVDYSLLTGAIDFEVVWKSGDIDKISEHEKKGQITFIPQLYLNRLAEREGTTQLKELIQSILLQNDEFREVFEQSEERRNRLREEIRESIFNYIDLRDRYKRTNDESKLFGTIPQLDAEIARLTAELERLRQASGFTNAELDTFHVLETSLKNKQEELAALESTRVGLTNFRQKIAERKLNVLSQLDNEYRQISQFPLGELEVSGLKDSLKATISDAFDDFEISAVVKDAEIGGRIDTLGVEIKTIETSLTPFKTKTVNKELHERRSADLRLQQNQRTQLTTKLAELASLKAQGGAARTGLYSTYEELFAIYKSRLEEASKPTYANIGAELLLQSELTFNLERFYEDFTSLFDLRARMNTLFTGKFDDTNGFIFHEAQHVSNIQNICDRLPKVGDEPSNEDTLMLKSWTTTEDLYEKLFDDYFEINYTIVHKGDNILRMSPGKRGVVLLQLILHISNADHPILIDQPEDSLDNRTVYNELKAFIRDKKEKRQIIIVTHNANLAVSTDAESIVVANQSGQQIGRDGHEFQFEYITGPLENTFKDEAAAGILYKMGIREHVCDILEGGVEAFREREKKYGMVN